MTAYRRDRSYLWNYRHGPCVDVPATRVPRVPPKEFLGLKVRSRVGIAAGILLNSRWVERFARLGFDILTYKTVRSAYRPSYPLPNWVFLEDPPGPLRGSDGPALTAATRAPRDVSGATSAVCFGMPSMPPSEWRKDVRRARRALRPGQVLIVSVVGTPAAGTVSQGAAAGSSAAEESLIEDFADCARWAAAAGAHVVEANYSCPNVTTAEGSVYQQYELAARLSGALRDALPSTPFLIKTGHFPRRDQQEAFLRAVQHFADGVVIVNGVSRRVLKRDGSQVFHGPERVGIIGHGIHEAAVKSVRDAVGTIRRHRWPLVTAAVGGVLGVDDPAEFFEAGAAAVLMGGGAALRPQLAIDIKKAHPEW